jgi:hypothetical protein
MSMKKNVVSFLFFVIFLGQKKGNGINESFSCNFKA